MIWGSAYMRNEKLFKHLEDATTQKILLLLKNGSSYLEEISRSCKISRVTAYRKLKPFIEYGLVVVEKEESYGAGKRKYFRLCCDRIIIENDIFNIIFEGKK